jgi:hypothetical protein
MLSAATATSNNCQHFFASRAVIKQRRGIQSSGNCKPGCCSPWDTFHRHRPHELLGMPPKTKSIYPHCCQSGRSSQVSREFELMARYVQKPRDDATMTAANMNFFSTFTPPASVNYHHHHHHHHNFHILLLQPTSTTSSGFSSALPPLPTHHSRPTRVTYNQPQG